MLDMEEQEHSTGTDYVELNSIWVDSFIQNLAYEFQKQKHLSGHPLPSLSLLCHLSSTPCPDPLLIHESLTPISARHQTWILPGPWCIRLHLWPHSSWYSSRRRELGSPKKNYPWPQRRGWGFKTAPQKSYMFSPKLTDPESPGVTQVLSYHCLNGTSHLSGVKWAYFRSLKALGISWATYPSVLPLLPSTASFV